MDDLRVSRNAPCPCGSGIKFKKCCLRREQSDEESVSDYLFGSDPRPLVSRPSHSRPTTDRSRTRTTHGRLPSLSLPDSAVSDDRPNPPPADTVPVLPVEVEVKYTYPEPYGMAEVTYLFPGGRTFVLENGLPIMVDDLKPGMRVRSQSETVFTVTGVNFHYEPPEPPSVYEDGRMESRVIGTVKHIANTVMEVAWPGYTATNTPDHPYYSLTRQAYVPAYDLRLGELLRSDTGCALPVESVGQPKRGLIEVYNLEVEHFHCYFVGPSHGTAVLVHNGTCILRPAEEAYPPGNDANRQIGLFNEGGVHPTVPEYGQLGPKTQGTLVFGETERYFISQVEGPASTATGAGFTPFNRTHVEAHAAQYMIDNNITHADLYVNYPGGPCQGVNGCNARINEMLSPGTTLNVHYQDYAGGSIITTPYGG